MDDQKYEDAINKGMELWLAQNGDARSTDGAARDMRAAYEVDSGDVQERHIVEKIKPVLARENIPAGDLHYVQAESRLPGERDGPDARKYHQNTSNLRIVWQDAVENEETLSLLNKAERSSGATQGINDPSGFRIYTDLDQGFYAILGSPNGKVVMRMLHDHKQHIGLRYVEKVVVLGTDKEKAGKQRHFYFVLSERRCPATPAEQPLPDSE